MSSITECINENCTCNNCGTCNYCETLKISDIPTQSRVSANTTLLGTDSYAYTVSQIEAYLNLQLTDAKAATFSSSTTTEALDNANDYACTDTTALRTLTLSASTLSLGSTSKWFYLEVKDESGGAGTNNITIDTSGAETIDGVNSITISVDYGAAHLYSNGTNWFTR